MTRFSLLPVALLISCCAAAQNTSAHAAAQNTSAHATPQTQNAAPADVKSGETPSSGMDKDGASKTSPGRASGKGRTRHGNATAHRPATPAAAANSSVSVIGEVQGSGTLNDPARNTALPGVSVLQNALGIASGTPIHVHLEKQVDSGHALNGDTIHGVLAAALGDAPNGSPVTLTVVAAAPAGQINSYGTLSLQVVNINGEQVLSQVITAEGKEGAKELPDAAPARGTEAEFTPDRALTVPAA